MAKFTAARIPAPAGIPADAIPVELSGNVPLPAGQVVITPYVRKQLTALGWQEGDPVPGDLGERIRDIQAEIANDIDTAKPDVPADFQLKRPALVNITDLPPERQAELQQHLANYKQEVAAQRQQQKRESELLGEIDPATPASVVAARRAAAAATIQSDRIVTEVVDDRPTKSPVAARTPATEPPTEPPTELPTGLTGAIPPMTHCPRCLWNLQTPFEVEPTDRDKESFLCAVLGMQRFQKSIEVFGGKMAVVFRGLTANEVQTINRQLTLQMRAGEIFGEGEYFTWLMEYRLICSIASIASQGNTTIEIKPLQDWENTDPLTTPLPTMREWFNTSVAVHEPLRRVLAQHQRQFQRLVEALEALSADPNFWNGIEPRA